MFIIQTTIDETAMAALAKANRKTLRRGQSMPVRTLAGFVVALETFLTVTYIRGGLSGWPINALLGLFMLGCLLSEDRVNGRVALRQISPQDQVVNAAFEDARYVRRTQSGENWWPYSAVHAVVETPDYFLLLLDRRHGQVYDKKGFSWGTPEEFRTFIQKKTGQRVQQMK